MRVSNNKDISPASNTDEKSLESTAISRRSLVAGAALLGGAALSTTRPAAAATPGNTSIYYASNSGVTGINDGTRDDAPLLQAAYNAAISAGANCLVLPVGVVYINSYTYDSNYPGSYVIRSNSYNFTIIVPAGCIIYVTSIDSFDVFQFLGSYSGITGGGTLIHTVPGANNSSPNNQTDCVHLAASSESCFIDNLTAIGFMATTQGVFDNSSSTRAFLSNLRVFICSNGVMQSSTATTVRCQMNNIYVEDAYLLGVQTSGANNSLTDIFVDQTSLNLSSNNYGVFCIGPIEHLTINGLRCLGSTGNSGVGLRISPSSQPTDGCILVSEYTLANYAYGVLLDGVINNPSFNQGHIANVLVAFKKQDGSISCGDTYLNFLQTVNCYEGLVCGQTPTTLSEGLFILNNVVQINVITPYFNTVGVVKSALNCKPMPSLPRPALTASDAGTQFWDANLTNPRFIYYSGTGSLWDDGTGASV